MARYSITISGDTLDELYSSAAALAGYGGTVAPTVHVAVSDTGGLTATAAPSAPAPVAAPSAPAPVAAPSAPAPVAAPAETDDDDAGPPVAAEFDKAGIPWDKRIHSETRNQNKDGTWKRRRNTDDVYYASVMAELSQRTAGQAPTAPPASPGHGVMDNGPVVIPSAPAPVVPPPPMVAPANVAPIPAPPVAAAPATPPAAPAPVVPVAEPVTSAAPAAAGMPFPVLMPKIAQAMKDGKFNNDGLKGYLAQWQLTDIGQLAANPVMAEQFHDWLKSGNLID